MRAARRVVVEQQAADVGPGSGYAVSLAERDDLDQVRLGAHAILVLPGFDVGRAGDGHGPAGFGQLPRGRVIDVLRNLAAGRDDLEQLARDL